MAPKKRTVLSSTGVEQAIRSLADKLCTTIQPIRTTVLIGIQTRGVPLARRIAQHMYEKTGHEVPVGILDITLYRDDVDEIASQPIIKETDLPLDLNDRQVVLVDDVLFTGRTIRAALDQLIDFGRPHAVRLCVLLDRGHRELPIQPDFVGKLIATSASENVVVLLKEIDGRDQVVVTHKKKNNNKTRGI
ncbi:MAG: bifunctional pyr operon transcriptional regulator/uracil phosphoribosyltransferase PyrR [Elusimicrobia bacterium]|nr:bifunctional pyr operon transcriptional regulator/uracil phosphoribosyltransferase PyrR [Elusimicrobiota bacterium]MBD3411836.1 bifunctional pyr operon transcriptional regulator/uracil phosphoribosyltransferase PyrR [Elusimicrobiota bacterium]